MIPRTDKTGGAFARNSQAVPAGAELDALRALLDATVAELIRTFAADEPVALSA